QLGCSNKTVVCGTDWYYDQPTIYDACCASTNYVFSYLGPFTNGIGPCAQTNSLIYIVTDECGNSNNCTQVVTILNALVLYPTLSALSFGSPVPTNPPTVLPGCCTNVTLNFLSSFTNSSGCEQNIYQVWQALDCCSNTYTCTNTVTLLPASPPVVCAPNKTVPANSSWSFDPPTPIASGCESNVTITVLSTVTSNTPCGQSLTRTWQIVDCCSESN